MESKQTKFLQLDKVLEVVLCKFSNSHSVSVFLDRVFKWVFMHL